MSKAPKTYGGWIQALDAISILVYSIFALAMLRKVIVGMSGASALAIVAAVGLSLVGYLLADLASGLVHCAADNFGEEDTFFVGPAFIKPFRDHHRDPEGITHHNFFEVNGNSCLVNLIVLVPAYYLIPAPTTSTGAVLGAFTLNFTLAIVLTNQFHKWAHQKNPAPMVKILQSLRLVLTPSMHQIHHTPPFERYYCITTGWLNPVLEKTGAFDWIHRTFHWARPKKPYTGDVDIA